MYDMPRLSIFKPEKGNDYKFFDRNIKEMFQVGGTDLHFHKYLGPYDQGDTNKDGASSPTQPQYSGDSLNERTIQDLLFLENRAEKIEINKNNKNDVIKLIGQPHTKSVPDDDNWIYIERVLSKGSYNKLGKNVLKTNNVLILTFNKYGILVEKNLLNKFTKSCFSEIILLKFI